MRKSHSILKKEVNLVRETTQYKAASKLFSKPAKSQLKTPSKLWQKIEETQMLCSIKPKAISEVA